MTAVHEMPVELSIRILTRIDVEQGCCHIVRLLVTARRRGWLERCVPGRREVPPAMTMAAQQHGRRNRRHSQPQGRADCRASQAQHRCSLMATTSRAVPLQRRERDQKSKERSACMLPLCFVRTAAQLIRALGYIDGANGQRARFHAPYEGMDGHHVLLCSRVLLLSHPGIARACCPPCPRLAGAASRS